IPFETVLTIAGSTPSYYPGQKDLITEIYYSPITEEILGGEFFGEVGVDKRVDVLSTAIYAKLKISDLSQLDLAYAPPFSPAKDPVVVTGFVAENMLDDKAIQMSAEELDLFLSKTNPNEFMLLDVRSQKEFEEGTIQNAINIPLDEIRNHIDFIKNQNKPIILFCRRGLRGYLAELILKHHHIKNMVNLAGGITVWKMVGGLVLKPKEVEA
ncbi:MAG: rhodanese-like domain-containing protein, partial [Lutibacter sp.]|nr:rhodanese-like domain-containing protein [Lutibacter sp.]